MLSVLNARYLYRRFGATGLELIERLAPTFN